MNYRNRINEIQTGYLGLEYGTKSLLNRTEIAVQKSELRRLGLPDNTPIPTHVFCLVRYDSFFYIKGKWYSKGLYVYEATASGVKLNKFEDTYLNSENIVIKKPVLEYYKFEQDQFKKAIEKFYRATIGYGWFSFLKQPLHTIFGYTENSSDMHMQICSELFANGSNAVNSGCFVNAETTNPLDCAVNNNFINL
jgi:hypothetical protein